MKKLMAGLCAITPVAAQITGQYGAQTGGAYLGCKWMLGGLLLGGLTVLVWLWVIKLWRELWPVKKKKKR